MKLFINLCLLFSNTTQVIRTLNKKGYPSKATIKISVGGKKYNWAKRKRATSTPLSSSFFAWKRAAMP